MEGAEVLLYVTGTIVATADSIGDFAAATFAARFYAAVASGQSVAAAVKQGKAAVDFMGLGEGWKHDVLARTDINPETQVLVKTAEE